MHEHIHAIDRFFGRYIAQIPESARGIFQFITYAGDPITIFVLACLLAAAALQRSQPRTALASVLCFAALGGDTILKLLFQRSRPDTLYVQNMLIKSYSFPSGHSFGAAVMYGFLAYLALKHLPQPFNYISAILLLLLIFMIGVSRVFLGAHFPSDVLAGWGLGFVSLFVILIIIKP